jgi:hypothetical protein
METWERDAFMMSKLRGRPFAFTLTTAMLHAPKYKDGERINVKDGSYETEDD